MSLGWLKKLFASDPVIPQSSGGTYRFDKTPLPAPKVQVPIRLTPPEPAKEVYPPEPSAAKEEDARMDDTDNLVYVTGNAYIQPSQWNLSGVAHAVSGWYNYCSGFVSGIASTGAKTNGPAISGMVTGEHLIYSLDKKDYTQHSRLRKTHNKPNSPY